MNVNSLQCLLLQILHLDLIARNPRKSQDLLHFYCCREIGVAAEDRVFLMDSEEEFVAVEEYQYFLFCLCDNEDVGLNNFKYITFIQQIQINLVRCQWLLSAPTNISNVLRQIWIWYNKSRKFKQILRLIQDVDNCFVFLVASLRTRMEAKCLLIQSKCIQTDFETVSYLLQRDIVLWTQQTTER